jgi:hypothetical protein
VRVRKADGAAGTLYTIGHSTRATRQLVDLLRARGVEQVVDVRTIPKSRHNPQFNPPALSCALHAVKIGYRHEKALGGLRDAHPNSVNLGWRNASFRGYADYMQSEEFAAGLARLERLAAQRPTAIMCAEASYRRVVASSLWAWLPLLVVQDSRDGDSARIVAGSAIVLMSITAQDDDVDMLRRHRNLSRSPGTKNLAAWLLGRQGTRLSTFAAMVSATWRAWVSMIICPRLGSADAGSPR